MITLRPFTNNDANIVLGWITDETAFYMWCSDRFKTYPLPKEELCNIYNDLSIKGYIAEDGKSDIGHLFVQHLGERDYKFGLIIVDPTQRGKGYGRKMLECALSYAKESLNAKSVSLCVFDDNVSARELYKKIGFEKTGKYSQPFILGENKKYFEMEYTIKE
jgi:RimJ/RimL family protein N-acetyltransferase